MISGTWSIFQCFTNKLYTFREENCDTKEGNGSLSENGTTKIAT